MTNPGLFGAPRPNAPTLPRGDVLATYDTYLEALKVVDRLAATDFPVDKVSIVGNDLKTVERVTGRMSYGRAALAGALSGVWFGLFFGLLLSMFSSNAGSTAVVAAALIGAAAGMIFGVISYAITRRSRDFTSQTAVLATNYQIIIAPELTARAQNLLAQPPSAS